MNKSVLKDAFFVDISLEKKDSHQGLLFLYLDFVISKVFYINQYFFEKFEIIYIF